MKKSLLALSVLFVLGACSTQSAGWRGEVGGKTLTAVDGMTGVFSDDATTFTPDAPDTIKGLSYKLKSQWIYEYSKVTTNDIGIIATTKTTIELVDVKDNQGYIKQDTQLIPFTLK
ncbi:MAG: hypothetical protein ACRC0X_04675 [Brevinema sp.]